MTAARDLREKALLVTTIAKTVSDTAKAIKAEASAATAAQNEERGALNAGPGNPAAR